MHAFTAVLAASSLLSLSSGSPLITRAQMCGSKPTSTGSLTPLSTPTNIQTASACQTRCTAMTNCLSFSFGLVSGAPKCLLFSVAASAVPAQSSSNLIVHDRACTSVPAVVPSASNPTGVNLPASGKAAAARTPINSAPAAAKAAKLAVRAGMCNAAPSGPTGTKAHAPLSTPANIKSMAACKVACGANKSCKSFEFGAAAAGGADVCRLFSVAASAVPARTSGQTFKVFDVGCSV